VGTNKTLLVIVFKETRVQVLVFQLPRVFHRVRDLVLLYPAFPQHLSVQEECLTVGVLDRLMLTVLIMLSAALMAVLMCAREQVQCPQYSPLTQGPMLYKRNPILFDNLCVSNLGNLLNRDQNKDQNPSLRRIPGHSRQDNL